MSHQTSNTHHPSLLNSQTHHHHHQPNQTAPIKLSNASDNEGVFVPVKTVSKVSHTSENCDPECKCSTCQLIKKLIAEGIIEECREQQINKVNNVSEFRENVPIASQVSPTNAQPFSSSIIQNNDASTSEHTNANDLDDDHSRSSTPDYMPRFFDDESGDSESSDDSEDKDGDDKELDKESERDSSCADGELAYQNDDRERSSTPDYLPRFFDDESGDSGSSDDDYDDDDANSDPENLKKSDKSSKKLVIERYKHLKESTECPQCGRNVSLARFQSHMLTHENPGFRCDWPNCGFFFSQHQIAMKHVSTDHLKTEVINSIRINRHLVKVDPTTGIISKVKARPYRKKISLTGHFQSSTSLGEFGSDKSKNKSAVDPNANQSTLHKSLTHKASSSESNSIDNESNDEDEDENHDDSNHENNSTNQTKPHIISVKCPKCEKTFIKRSKIVRHYLSVHREWKPYYCRWPKCHFVSAIHGLVINHADKTHFNCQNKQKAKNYVGKRNELPPNDPVLKQICAYNFRCVKKDETVCPKCKRTFRFGSHLQIHLFAHRKTGFACNWSGCGFFYPTLDGAKKHIRTDHLQVEADNNLIDTNQYLILKVNPKTGKKTKVKFYQNRKQRE